MYRLKRRGVLLLGDRYHQFLTSRHLDSVHERFGGQLLAITDGIANLLAAIAALTAVCLTSYYSLSQFPGMSGISHGILDRLEEPVLLASKLFVGYLPHLFVVLLIVSATYVLTRILQAIAQAMEHGDISFPGFYPEWAKPTSKLFTFVLVVFALVVMFPYLPGGDSPAFRGISIFIGVLVSLGVEFGDGKPDRRNYPDLHAPLPGRRPGANLGHRR